MKICSYIVRRDSGIAPNPFWGFCTFALCTPNHQGINLDPDDWIMGTQTRSCGNKLVYAMKVAERLHFDKYFNDKRFESKKPSVSNDWRCRCGDNIYFLADDNTWRQVPVPYHNKPEERKKDTKHPYVYVATQYYYFGEKAVEIPSDLTKLIWNRQGCKCKHQESLVVGFIEWLKKNYEPGVTGLPRDRHQFINAPCNS